MDPKRDPHSVKTYIQAVKNDISSHQPDQIKNRKQNLSQGEKKALASLKDREDIIISKADKGGAVVIQNVEDYIKEAERQLGDPDFYQKVERDLTTDHVNQINTTIDRFQQENLLPERTAKALKTHHSKPAKFYMLPKVHKKGNP